MFKVKYGIMSASSIAPRFISAVRAANAGEICAISSRTGENAEKKAKEWGIPVAYKNHEALLNDENINTVYISSVNSAHYEMTKLALEKGKNVICEKPCTTSKKETEELFEIAKSRGLFLMEAQKMLFLPVINQVFETVKNGTLGEIALVELSHSFLASYNNWLFDPSLGGGTLLSSGIYAIQFVLSLFGDISEITGVFTRDEGLAENGYTVSGKTKSGVIFVIKNSTSATLDNSARIFGSKGNIVIPEYWKARKAIISIKGQDEKEIHLPVENEFVYEASHIKECLEKKILTSPVVTPLLSVKGIEVIEKIKALPNYK